MKKIILNILVLFITGISFAQSYSGGAGTVGDPYQIANKTDLKYLSEHSAEWAKHFIQTADVVFLAADFQSGGDFYNTGLGFIPIGDVTTNFTGTFNGQGNTITGLKSTRPTQDYVGFFGYISAAATLSNIGLISVEVSGKDAVGGLCGYNDGVITNSYTTGSISGTSYYAGGLCGLIDYDGRISNSYSKCSVNGVNNIGGFVGASFGATAASITKCFSTGTVSGTSSVGGFSGQDYYTTILNCYWDTQTSGRATSFGGIGKTTAQMKTEATFTDAIWDFVVETTNGTDDIWKMSDCVTGGYPFLAYDDESLNGAGTVLDPYLISSKSNLKK